MWNFSVIHSQVVSVQVLEPACFYVCSSDAVHRSVMNNSFAHGTHCAQLCTLLDGTCLSRF